MPIVNPDDLNRQKQMLNNAAEVMAKNKYGVDKTQAMKSTKGRGGRQQLLITITVVVAMLGLLVLLSVLHII